MGLLSQGEALSWRETMRLATHVRRQATRQFAKLYRTHSNFGGKKFLFGEEVEFVVVKMDAINENARLALRSDELLRELQRHEQGEDGGAVECLWRPEFANYMLEGIPAKPYDMADLFNPRLIEFSMKKRREMASKLLRKDEILLTLSAFPRLGCPNFTFPLLEPKGESLFWPCQATFQAHPRFKIGQNNLRLRRGEKIAINVPVYKDEETPRGHLEDLGKYGNKDFSAAKEGHIYMDAVGLGSGLCCLQVTLQATDVEEAELLYDQLAPLCPILLALTACSPIFRGYLADTDCRWDVLAASVDDRTREERGLEPLRKNKFALAKSRCDSISTYISTGGSNDLYNDLHLVYDEDVYKHLLAENINCRIARHIAHLFTRDPLFLFGNKVFQDESKESDHFENLQSTNWQSMRFKPPPSPDSDVGFRVEFRTCEVQFTDFENAAVICFIILISRCILSFELNLLVPISKVDENMTRAQKRDAVLNEKFHFRSNIESSERPEMVEMTIEQVMSGDRNLNFKGLIPLIKLYLRDLEVDVKTISTLSLYWDLLLGRSNGRLKTNARFMRDFVQNHEEYEKDSVVNQKVNYDLIKKIDEITKGNIPCKDLFGDIKN